MQFPHPCKHSENVRSAGANAQRFFLVAAMACAASASAFAQTSDNGVAAASSASLAIKPLTVVDPDGYGYMADPMPVHLAPDSDSRMQIISGTTQAIIHCSYPISAGCFKWDALKVKVDDDIKAEIDAAGDHITNFQNIDLFQDDDGTWHAAVTVGVASKKHPGHWTLVTHAHATEPAKFGLAPLAWSVDTVLSGSFSKPVQGNYDGKYYEDNGHLYLLYVRSYEPEPDLRNEIVIQPMTSPIKADAVDYTVLLRPGDKQGQLASEQFANTPAWLVEAPNIAHINGKYALIYSTGSYLTTGYKAGVAWSDTLMPEPGHYYRKVLQPDTLGVWGTPGRLEVRYLVQSEKPRWPNFTGDQVLGPGVAAAVQSPACVWWFYFNGYAPGDMTDNGQVEPSHRRPYGLQLREAVPFDESVKDVSDAELATWLQPETN
jgi:hypothetical protein